MISELEQQVLESISKREAIRFVRVSNTLVEQGDIVDAVVVSLTPASDSRWEAELVLKPSDGEFSIYGEEFAA